MQPHRLQEAGKASCQLLEAERPVKGDTTLSGVPHNLLLTSTMDFDESVRKCLTVTHKASVEVVGRRSQRQSELEVAFSGYQRVQTRTLSKSQE